MASSLGVMREHNQIIRFVLPLMAAVTCLTTGAASASASATARPSDTDPQDWSGAATAAHDDNDRGDDAMASFDPFEALRTLGSLGNSFYPLGNYDDVFARFTSSGH